MAKKSTIGADPLGNFLGLSKPADSEQSPIDQETPEPVKQWEHQKPPGKSRPGGEGGKGLQHESAKLTKEERRRLYRFSTELAPDLQERLRNAVYWTPGATVAGYLETAVRDLLERIEQENGGAFKPRPEALKGGRPLG
jgi:hypothetical protein